jgi:hypothetical protein
MIHAIREQLLDRLCDDVVLECCKSAMSQVSGLLKKLWDLGRPAPLVRRSLKRVRKRKRSGRARGKELKKVQLARPSEWPRKVEPR